MKVALIDIASPPCEVVSRAFALRGHSLRRARAFDPCYADDLVVLDAVSDPDRARAGCLLARDTLDSPLVWVVTPDRDGRPWVDAGASEWVTPGADPHWLDARVMLAERACSLRRELTTRGADAERERMQSRLLVADRMASVGTLAAGVAHEINNPLTYVYTNIEMLMRGGALTAEISDPDRRRRVENSLAQCREGAERVRQIVRNLLTFARPDQDSRHPVFVEELLEAAVALCLNQIRHRARLVRDYHPAPPVEANPARLAQAFLNLILHAVRAIPEGDAERNTITLRVELDPNGQVLVSIRDTGVGISPDHIHRIFDPVFTDRTPGEGSGLGLSVCHSLVCEIGGDITLESTPGRGTVFRVAIPPTRVEPERPSKPAPANTRRASVLIIDDETNLRISLGQILSLDHRVTLMASAREALAAFAAGARFDVVLCDLMMPEVSGIDLYAELERIAPEQVPRVIFLSGGAFTPRAQAFLERIENPRIEKPFDLDVLRELIQHTLVNTPSVLPPSSSESGKS